MALRYDEDKADLIHDEEYEAVLHPLPEQLDATRAVGADYDDRDLRTEAPAAPSYVLPAAPVKNKTFWTGAQRDLVAGDPQAGGVDHPLEPFPEHRGLAHARDQALGQMGVGIDEAGQDDAVAVADQLGAGIGGDQLIEVLAIVGAVDQRLQLAFSGFEVGFQGAVSGGVNLGHQ